MGQVIRRFPYYGIEQLVYGSRNQTTHSLYSSHFCDLCELPPELGLTVLSYLDATDLCLAACIWDGLGNDEILWMRLCKTTWRNATIYNCHHPELFEYSYKKLYLMLDEASIIFNSNPEMGCRFLIEHGLVADDAMEIAKFIHSTNRLWIERKREFLEIRIDVLDKVVLLQNFENVFLPNALRQLFAAISAPSERGAYLEEIIQKFSHHFCNSNPQLGLSSDAVYVLCFSLIMLSVDLTSPHIKNKMSKREFIRNTRGAVTGVTDDLAGHLYDNIYLIGHVATHS